MGLTTKCSSIDIDVAAASSKKAAHWVCNKGDGWMAGAMGALNLFVACVIMNCSFLNPFDQQVFLFVMRQLPFIITPPDYSRGRSKGAQPNGATARQPPFASRATLARCDLTHFNKILLNLPIVC